MDGKQRSKKREGIREDAVVDEQGSANASLVREVRVSRGVACEGLLWAISCYLKLS